MPDSNDVGPAQVLTSEGAQGALDGLNSITQATLPTGVVLIEQPMGQPVEVSQLRPTDKSAPKLGELIQAAAKKFSALEAIDYGPSAEPAGGQVMWRSIADVPLLAPLSEQLGDLAELPLFDPRPSRLREVQLVGTQAQAARDVDVALYQSLGGSQVLAESSRIGVVMRKGVLDVPRQRGQLVILDRGVDAIGVGQYVFFTRRAAFDRLFGFLEELRDRAQQTFNDVTSVLKIVGRTEMIAAVTGAPAMLGKMASIQRKLDKYPSYKAALTMPNLLSFARSHPECGVELSGQGDEAQLVFQSDPRNRFKILKLLDDDFLRSELTKFEYEANSKSSPIGT
jgi:hypothetical protein